MLRSGTICVSFLYKYLTSDSEYKDDNGQVLNKKAQKLRCLSDTFQSYGGVLSKLSQMLCLNDYKSDVFSDCKPFSKEKTFRYIQEKYNKGEFNDQLKSLDLNIHKSGSIGQVHKGIDIYGNKIILKVQYVGLFKQTKTDLVMLDKITSYVYNFSDMKYAMKDIKTQMYKELDYVNEKNNQEFMYKLWEDDETIEIPKIIFPLCNSQHIGMHYVEGISLKQFIEDEKYSQDDKNIVGRNIVKFIFENIYKHGILYSDAHYGNFLVKEDLTLCILDFGCLQDIDEDLLINLRSIHVSLRNEDKELFFKSVTNMGILTEKTTEESQKYMYEYFKIQYMPWLSKDFQFTEEWLELSVEKDTDLMNKWILPQNMVYFNKIPYGLYHLLTKISLKGDFKDMFDKMFETF